MTTIQNPFILSTKNVNIINNSAIEELQAPAVKHNPAAEKLRQCAGGKVQLRVEVAVVTGEGRALKRM